MSDILISMNKTTDKLWKYADEWEKTPEHFDGVNPFCLAIHAVRQITNAPDAATRIQPEQKVFVHSDGTIEPLQKHGHWIGYPRFLTDSQCSVCKETYVGDCRMFKFCPYCGAMMDEGVKPDDRT